MTLGILASVRVRWAASTWLKGSASKFAQAHAVKLHSGLLLAFSVGFYLFGRGTMCRHLGHLSVSQPRRWQAHSQTARPCAHLWTTALGVTLNVLGLAAFKYAFFIDDTFGLELLTTGTFRLDAWMLPLGISFFTFQAISFLVDVHRRTLATPPDLLSFATYLTFFPQLVAGPIVRATFFLAPTAGLGTPLLPP